MANAVALSTLLDSDIPDPTDFPKPAPGLRALDSSLRCNICSELFEAPVTLLCGHCFCSVCIRSSISEKPECPNCRKVANEGHLRVNPAMEEAVAAWKDARPFVLRLSKEDETRKSLPQPKPSKKRKWGSLSTSPTRPQTSEVSEDESSNVPTSDPREEDMLAPSSDNVECPICSRVMPLTSINSHIDKGCPSPSSSSSLLKKAEKKKTSVGQWGKLLGGGGGERSKSRKGKEKATAAPTEQTSPLPKVSYAILKERQIKDLLTNFGLSVKGSKDDLISRHQRWVIIYNANLDRASHLRLTVAALRKDLEKWERGREKKGNAKDVDPIAHQKANEEEFRKLVEAARPKKIQNHDDTNNDITPTHRKTRSGIEDDAIVVDSEEEREAVG